MVQGRSDIVGKRVSSLPMGHRLDANETVTVCHTRSAGIVLRADILMALADRPASFTAILLLRAGW